MQSFVVANFSKSVHENVAGEFFVDSTCIDCDTCRQLAPETFGEASEYAYVFSQPTKLPQIQKALRALLCCPTGSIGTLHTNNSKAVRDDFPLPLADNIFYCGFNSPKSYGANSYFILDGAGNWLIDSPKYLPFLVEKFSVMGGIRYIFLTHRDDVADAERYAATFSSERIIHRADQDSQPEAEKILDGQQPVELTPGFIAIPTPGHTQGHCVLLMNNRFLFTGDHLWWDRNAKRLHASRSACWYSWQEQTQSMEKLKEFRFSFVLCGHGQRIELPESLMQSELALLVERMCLT